MKIAIYQNGQNVEFEYFLKRQLDLFFRTMVEVKVIKFDQMKNSKDFDYIIISFKSYDNAKKFW